MQCRAQCPKMSGYMIPSYLEPRFRTGNEHSDNTVKHLHGCITCIYSRYTLYTLCTLEKEAQVGG